MQISASLHSFFSPTREPCGLRKKPHSNAFELKSRGDEIEMHEIMHANPVDSLPPPQSLSMTFDNYRLVWATKKPPTTVGGFFYSVC